MSERPFMQLYVSDFIGDTLHLSTEQIGAYMLLLMAMWNAGGRLPNDDAKLARVVRMSVKKWKAIEADLLGFFDIIDSEIYHNRLTKELQKSERKSQSRADAGAKGGSAKALKDKEARLANATDLPRHSPDTITRENTSSLRSDFCPESEKSAPASPTVIGLPTVNGDMVSISEADVAEWSEAFPAVNVRRQLAAMRSWLNANPKNRKTSKGMKRFVVSWLTRDQDRGGGRQHPQAQSPPRPQSPSMQRHHDIHARLKRELYGESDDQFAGPTVDIAAGDFRSH
ncbi:DUF1376 domain-containing protein [Sinorhizobium meliloti]|uniref:YdaU family protein n=1 Tax=Rhizobium meliloti TaxID=382 RepID=UPI000FD9CB67|nr:DUF1376 domain-containing protein [Sinorhizobium meliloti]RVK60582.1 DUF1376 domain-containing protein [Sinorhizobium meliloti]